jgi:hypothetical protein
MSEAQRMFCPQCGSEFFTPDTTEHELCIKWGVNVRGYKGRKGWLEACIANGKRVMGTLSDMEALQILNPKQE